LEHYRGRTLSPGKSVTAFITQGLLRSHNKGKEMERLGWLPYLSFPKTNPLDLVHNPELKWDFQSQPSHVLLATGFEKREDASAEVTLLYFSEPSALPPVSLFC